MANRATLQILSVSSESRRAVRTREQQRSDGAQGNQKSISRQDEAAELEEMRVHRGGFPISMPQRERRNRPTGPCSSAPVNPS